MNREIQIGNGRLLIGFDERYRLREAFSIAGRAANRIGPAGCHFLFGTDGRFVSTADPEFRVRIKYLKETMCTSVTLTHNLLQMVGHCCDVVDFELPILVRRIRVRNLADFPRTLAVYHQQDFSGLPETLFPNLQGHFDSAARSVVHRTEDAFFSATFRDTREPVLNTYGFGAPDELHDALPETARAGSFIKAFLRLEGFQEAEIFLVLILAGDPETFDRCQRAVETVGADRLVDRTCAYWRLWLTGRNHNFGHLSEKVADLFKRSVLVLRSQCGSGGLINDGSPRPALSEVTAGMALDAGGFSGAAITVYRHITPPTPADAGTLLSALWKHYLRVRDAEFLRFFWSETIIPQADRLVRGLDHVTGLPEPGSVLWSNGSRVDLFTVATCYGGLTAAKRFAIAMGDGDRSVRYETVAEKIKFNAERVFVHRDQGRLVRFACPGANGTWTTDPALDSAILGLIQFDLFKPEDPRLIATVDALSRSLWVKTPSGGLVRTESEMSGPPSAVAAWFVPTLWLARYLIARAANIQELRQAQPIFEWVVGNARGTGLLGDAVIGDQRSDQPFRPSPWSQAEFILAVAEYLEKLEALYHCEHCGGTLYQFHGAPADGSPELFSRIAQPSPESPSPGRIRTFEYQGRRVSLTFDLRECLGCGRCRLVCHQKVIQSVQHKAYVEESRLPLCTLCLECEKNCPVGAIRFMVSSPESAPPQGAAS